MFLFLDGNAPRRVYGVYIFARDCTHVTDFNARNKCLTQALCIEIEKCWVKDVFVTFPS